MSAQERDDNDGNDSDGRARGSTRREFLAQSAAASATLAAGGAAFAADPLPLSNVGADRIPHKPFGSSGQTLSILGVGGFSLADAPSYDEAERIVHEAVDAGLNFFDNAWEYHGHRSEEWMGKALAGRRDRVFLMTKVCTHGRGKDVALQQLEESLRRLGTDHLDLWQIHEVIYWNDPDLCFRPGGAVEALVEAKRQGKTRFIGFTGHKHPEIHLRMLALAEQRGVTFDSVQMPLNAFDATFRSFEDKVLPAVRRHGAAALGMKSLGGGGEALQQGVLSVDEALRYALSLPVATTVSGIDSLAVLRQNLAIARGFRPMSAAQMQALRQRCAADAADGHLELYKTTKRYDAEVGRAEHGYPSPKELPL
ncbi:MAG: Ferredoxin [bacterium]|nr:Ferredoxin [bacterium]